MTNREEIERRRTFAIISHPDAGKTTLTEKLLLYGGAINQAGSVKGKQSAKHAVSDWMDIEKQRGISVTSSVLQFNYAGKCVNILDTPGHQDFSVVVHLDRVPDDVGQETHRVLMPCGNAAHMHGVLVRVKRPVRRINDLAGGAVYNLPILVRVGITIRLQLLSEEAFHQRNINRIRFGENAVRR